MKKKLMIYLFPIIFMSGCFNPFAPELDENLNSNNSPISDLTKVDGIFQNLQYAYSFKDTTIYGDLVANDFNFTYRDYDLGFDVSWGRDDEMRVTNGLFQNSQRLDLIWNNILLISSDSTNIVRSFNLTITFNPTDIVRVDGKVNLTLRKNTINKWQIVRWIDESNF
ncbi:MAG: hypothetical protein NTX22_04775 [Ignavibacteriales bacterium]|nr:hypothetical protein [Ignavibacteriales bacterium]